MCIRDRFYWGLTYESESGGHALGTLAAHLTVGNGYLYTQYAGRAPALAETASLRCV